VPTVAYRPSSQIPATAWARHLDRVRRERGWSATRMFEEVLADLHLGEKSRSAFLPLLGDRQPDDETATVLARHFGEPRPEDQVPATGSEPVSLEERRVLALERQATAAEAQVEATRENTAMLRAMITALRPGLDLEALAEQTESETLRASSEARSGGRQAVAG
jgi:hypothetical protein